MKIGSVDITNCKIGSTQVNEVRIGSTLVWQYYQYLLDLYPGAAAAYSLRKLRSAYTGSAIRVRRSSDNAEQDIGFNSSNELDTVTLLAFVGAGSGFITTWYEQGLNGYNLVMTAAASQPRIVNAGVLDLENGKPTIRHDGSNDGLFLSNQPIFRNVGIGYIFSVYKWRSTSGTKVPFYVSTNVSLGSARAAIGSLSANKNSIFGRRLDADSAQIINSVANYGTNLQLHTAVFDWANSDAFQYINGALDGSSTTFQTSGNTSNTNALTAGTGAINTSATPTAAVFASSPADVNISEIILYSSSIDRLGIETNINNYYGIY